MNETLERFIKTIATRFNVFYCEEKGCWNTHTTQCGLWVREGETLEYTYCFEHAYKEGFCWGCGGFWAGIENFDFSASHLCPNCEENERYDEDFIDDEDYYPSDYPHDHPAYMREEEPN